VPAQAPEATHEVALAADHDSVDVPPLEIALGPTLRLTLGAFAEVAAVTVVDWVAVPPGPVHVTE
jgi:hypothetical protein